MRKETKAALAGLCLFGGTGAASAAHLEYFNDAATRGEERFEVFCAVGGGTPGNCDPGNDGVGIIASPLFALSGGTLTDDPLGDYTDDDGDPSTQNGQLFNIVDLGYEGPGSGQNDERELAFVNDNLFDVNHGPFAFGVKTDLDDLMGVDDENFTFTSAALYVLFVVGLEPRTGLAVNRSGEAVTYNFRSVGQGAGLSHYVEYGSVAPIPLPAAAWLLLGALGGLAALRRKRVA